MTILTGTNNSGKSSLSKLLHLISDSAKHSNLDRLEFKKGHHNLGSFVSCLPRNSQKQNIYINLLLNDRAPHLVDSIELFPGHLQLDLCFKQHQGESGIQYLTNVFGFDSKFKESILLYAIQPALNEGEAWIFINIKYFLFKISSTISRFKTYPKSEKRISLETFFNHKPKLSEKHKGTYIEIDYNNPRVDWEPFPKDYVNLNTNIINIEIINEFLIDYTDKDKSEIVEILNEFVLDFISNIEFTNEDWEYMNLDVAWDIKYCDAQSSTLLYFYKQFDQINYIFNKKIKDIDFTNKIPDALKLHPPNAPNQITYLTFNLQKHIESINKFEHLSLNEIINPEFIHFYSNFLPKKLIGRHKALISAIDFSYLEAVRANAQIIYTDISQGTIINDLLSQFSNTKIEESKFKFLNKWIKRFELGDKIEFTRISNIATKVTVIKKGKEFDLSELGYGMIQFLPILLTIILKFTLIDHNNIKKIKYLIIEEPESNLHPKLQSLLADFFLDAKKTFNITFIIETHSEYLIRKLQYLTAKKILKPEDTIIYYFNDPDKIPKGEKQVKEMRIREDGMMDDDFGDGFFDESTRLTIDLLKLQNKN